MGNFNEKYVTNEEGERIAVLLDMADYKKILDELEELESIKAYDSAKASTEEAVPLDQALREIEQDRR